MNSRCIILQVDLSKLRNHIGRALGEGYEEARICPALDELYSLLGRPTDDAMDESISRMMASIPGAFCLCNILHIEPGMM